MFEFNIDENVVSKTNGITIFNSTDDDEEMKKSVEIIKNKVDHLIKIEERISKIENKHNLCLQGKLKLH